ncbi:DUF2931 family protein [Zobellia galactanivorans]|uniref:DUF2931 family protein n=1 Tax=Zobellia galactanivorans (strain DSM 12802 / CCUG 47099 / CIP 106680 / NCIMB 13871 / Dsij) TaxID=63186 RepID=G0L9D7_ZOBGA|nr:DUF2931 family protein [Zobellia galactanivorans]CAZ94495.1 Conserved hypothetical protein [Zobellia galactanivorans]
MNLDRNKLSALKRISLIGLVLIGFCCKPNKNNNQQTTNSTMKTFEWRPTECAPEHYPIGIYQGGFITEDDEYFMIPNGGVVSNGWGNSGSTWVTGPDFKPVPNKLKIIWISYTENQFYFGDFNLPTDKITELFEKGYINEHGKHKTYNNLIVCLAPGGAVSVFIMGAGTSIEIGHYQAIKTEVAMGDFKPSAKISLDEYVQNRKNEFSDETKKVIAQEGIPIGKWTEYRQSFLWKPTFKHKDDGVLQDFSNKFYNGESYKVRSDNPILNEYKEYPPSKSFYFHWKDKNNNRYGSKIKFDEEEIWNAFKTIYKNPETTQAELVLEIDKYNRSLKISLESSNDTIVIEKAEVKMFTSD